MTEAPLFFLVAGEESGDFLGAALMRALKKKADGRVRFIGVGGPRMEKEGMTALFPQSDLAHMGLFELLVHVPKIRRRMDETVRAVEAHKPAALVTIDSPDFCFRVAKRLKGKGVPLIHYVAPTVWAWRAKRAKKIAAFLDHLLALLPFEPPYFTAHGLPCTFVGHPLVESGAGSGDAARFRAKAGITDGAPLLALLPGSRTGEIRRLMPVFREVCALLKRRFPKMRVVMPLAANVAERAKSAAKNWPVPVTFTDNDADKYDALAASCAALACSGTVSVELAMARVPTVIAYKTNPLTVFILRRFFKTKYVTLINIMKGRMVMPEYLQEKCVSFDLAQAVGRLLEDEPARKVQKDELDEIASWLGKGQFVPSEKAAETVLKVVGSVQ